MVNKIVFLILNYETYWETYTCVNSIYKIMGTDDMFSESYEIVIVDNGSKNNSFQKLKSAYKNIKGLYVLETGENLGFARGNNFGFVFAKNNLNPDFIVMINNDIVMTDINFKRKLLDGYNKYTFDVAGPNVILPSGKKLNPMPTYIYSERDVKMRIIQLKKQILLCKLKIEPIYALFIRLKCKFYCDNKYKIEKQIIYCGNKYQLHGCFLIFSRNYIKMFDGLYSKTFLYEEETLLRLRCTKAGLKMVFLKDINALHNESRTERYIGGNINKRHLQRFINMLDSSKVIHEYLVSNNLL